MSDPALTIAEAHAAAALEGVDEAYCRRHGVIVRRCRCPSRLMTLAMRKAEPGTGPLPFHHCPGWRNVLVLPLLMMTREQHRKMMRVLFPWEHELI